MASDIYTIADTHFGHENAWKKFKLADGSPLRPFTSTEEMDETMVERWNAVVRPQDKVYHLGDVAMRKEHLGIVRRLNGHKRLVRGNHDIFETKDYLEVGFEEIYGVRVFEKENLILSHIPLHPECLKERTWVNVHGHLHSGVVKRNLSAGEVFEPDPNYRCVSVEQVNYTPVLLY